MVALVMGEILSCELKGVDGMKMQTAFWAVVSCILAVANVASADLVRGIGMDFVTIGNVGNGADTFGLGAVGYSYRIGKYEVTNAQWNAFTTAAGTPTGEPANAYDASAYWTGSLQPVNCVSAYEAAQFCNYLTSGDKSKGAYQFSGNNLNPGSFLGINRDAAKAAYGAIYVIPTADEWHKAAYYKPDGSGYSLYANGKDTPPVAGVDSNFAGINNSSPWNVGTGLPEQNGTYDIMGNVWEWNETIFTSNTGIRGGSYLRGAGNPLISSSYGLSSPSNESYSTGFRIVAIVPEPSMMLLLSLGGLILRKRK
jgi:formylglycine-generating enzyme